MLTLAIKSIYTPKELCNISVIMIPSATYVFADAQTQINIYRYAYSSTESNKRTLQLQQRTTGKPVQLLSGRMCTLWVVKPETHAGHTQARMHSHTDTHTGKTCL